MTLKCTLLLAMFGVIPAISGAAPLDIAAFIKERGWTGAKIIAPFKMPVNDIVPVMYFTKTGAPACGLLSQSKSGASFIEMLGPDPSTGWPQCMGINDVAAFDIDNKKYLVFELANRDTREDTHREFFYVYKDRAGVYTADKMPGIDTPAEGARPLFKGRAKGALEGVRLAKAAFIKRAAAGLALVQRDSIYADTAAYAVFADQTHTKCAFVLQSGSMVSKFDHTLFSNADACTDTLATSKFDKGGKTYYMTMFRGLKQKRMAIVSVTNANVITAEKELAALAAANAPMTDMRSVRMFLLPYLK